MNTTIKTPPPVEPDIRVTIEMSADEMFYLWAVVYTGSNGSVPGDALRGRVDDDIQTALNLLADASPRMARARLSFMRDHSREFGLAGRVARALEQA